MKHTLFMFTMIAIFAILNLTGCNAIQDDASVSGEERQDNWYTNGINVHNSAIDLGDLKRLTRVMHDAESQDKVPQVVEKLKADGVEVEKLASGRYIFIINGVEVRQWVDVRVDSQASRRGEDRQTGGDTGDKDQKADGELTVPVTP